MMKSETSVTTPPTDAIHSVEFYPSIDDQVYVSLRIGEAAAAKTWTAHLYNLFLFVNAIVFPSFLFWLEHYLAGLLIFVGNLLALMFLIPRVNSDSIRKFYEKLFGNRENKIARAELREDGLFYSGNGCYSFFSWQRIERIEQTVDAIYFFVDDNGFGIRKNGFPYKEEQVAFIEFAWKQLKSARSELTPQQQIS